VVEHLPSKHKTLSLSPSTIKKKLKSKLVVAIGDLKSSNNKGNILGKLIWQLALCRVNENVVPGKSFQGNE
jgi:hypothetical protein